MKPRKAPLKRTELARGKPLERKTPMPRSGRIQSRGSVGDAHPDGPTTARQGPVKQRKPAGFPRTDPAVRFARLVKPGDVPDVRPDLGPCLIYTGATNGKGYGQFRYREGRRNGYAHRFAWEAEHGPITDELTVDHLCRVRRCVNVRHLELVDSVTNTKRAKEARTQCRRGHDLSPDNLYVWNGIRYCRACRRRSSKDHQARSSRRGERAAREGVKARSGGRCEVQVGGGVCTGRATDWCHRRARSQGGKWATQNGLHGCRACHRWTHAQPEASRVNGWIVDSCHEPVEVPVLRRGVWVLLDDEGGIAAVEGSAA